MNALWRMNQYKCFVWMWFECETSNIYISFCKHKSKCLPLHIPINIRPKLFCVWFICTHRCRRPELPSCFLLTSASPSCDSLGGVLYDRRLRNTGNEERDYIWWNGETLSHYDKQDKKKAATFSKCHFGNFQLTSDHNSLSSTLGCVDALFSAQLKTSVVLVAPVNN